MGIVTEKRARMYHTKNREFVCPACATDEERENADPGELVAEDKIHDDNPVYCIRCKKKIER
ncbi:MAG TPA: hypothetical protein VHO84_01740 [Syntrophorhabdaceae bacterium]|nr:hypothetical protein [Syntrophorhabdaceae bacterium]